MSAFGRKNGPSGMAPGARPSFGVARPMNVFVETFGTAKIAEELIAKAVGDVFDLRPAAIIHHLDLRRPIYKQTAAYGHFGRPELDLPWERLDKVEALRKATGFTGEALRVPNFAN